MTVRALVVGCDAYPRLPGADLAGAVSDALAFREWLLGDGGVHPADLRFLASCSPAGARLPHGVQVDGSADTTSMSNEVRVLVTEQSADRLYVYFAGHGCRTDPLAYLARDAIAFTDVDPVDPGPGCVVVNELTTQLAQGDFGEIVVILDARLTVPFQEPFQAIGFGPRWHGRRISCAAAQFFVMASARLPPAGESACGETDPTRNADGATAPVRRSGLTAALLDGLAGAGAAAVFDDTNLAGRLREVRWSSLERFLHSELPDQPPRTCGQDSSLVFARFPAAGDVVVTSTVRSSSADRPNPDVGMVGGDGELGGFEVRSPDAHAMLTVEDASGVRQAVGVGSIVGLLPAGSYTAVLVDPAGIDPRAGLDVGPGRLSEVRLDRPDRRDGFRLIDDDSMRWSSAAGQLAAATREVWSIGHRSFLLIGGTAQVARMHSPERQLIQGPDAVDPGDYERGELPLRGGTGWWLAVPVSKPWCTVRIGGHRVTVPVAPDSVTAVAVTAGATAVALFDNTHADPEQIAKQDRVQEYIAAGQLGAADLTSRGPVARRHRWPWGASATVRRLIDEKRPLMSDESTHTEEDVRSAGDASPGPAVNTYRAPDGDPPHQFVAHVPPAQRHRLVGRGPWAVWLDW